VFQVGTQRNCRRNICRIDGGSPWLRTVRGEARQTYNALENLARGEPPEKASGTAEPLPLFTLSWVRVGSVSVPCLFRVCSVSSRVASSCRRQITLSCGLSQFSRKCHRRTAIVQGLPQTGTAKPGLFRPSLVNAGDLKINK